MPRSIRMPSISSLAKILCKLENESWINSNLSSSVKSEDNFRVADLSFSIETNFPSSPSFLSISKECPPAPKVQSIYLPFCLKTRFSSTSSTITAS